MTFLTNRCNARSIATELRNRGEREKGMHPANSDDRSPIELCSSKFPLEPSALFSQIHESSLRTLSLKDTRGTQLLTLSFP